MNYNAFEISLGIVREYMFVIQNNKYNLMFAAHCLPDASRRPCRGKLIIQLLKEGFDMYS